MKNGLLLIILFFCLWSQAKDLFASSEDPTRLSPDRESMTQEVVERESDPAADAKAGYSPPEEEQTGRETEYLIIESPGDVKASYTPPRQQEPVRETLPPIIEENFNKVNPESSCNTYKGYGSFKLKVCDEVVLDKATITVKSMKNFDGVDYVHFAVLDNTHFLSPNKKPDNKFFWSYTAGTYMELTNYDGSTATVSFYADTQMLYAACLEGEMGENMPCENFPDADKEKYVAQAKELKGCKKLTVGSGETIQMTVCDEVETPKYKLVLNQVGTQYEKDRLFFDVFRKEAQSIVVTNANLKLSETHLGNGGILFSVVSFMEGKIAPESVVGIKLDSPTAAEYFLKCSKGKSPEDMTAEEHKECTHYLPVTAKIPGFLNVAYKDVRVLIPEGYSKAGELAAKNAQNCRDKMVPYLTDNPKLVPPTHMVFAPMSENKGSLGYNGYGNCGWGWNTKNGSVSCFVGYNETDALIEKGPKYFDVLQKVNAGSCVDEFGSSLLQANPHELAHNIVINLAPMINTEGFATYLATKFEEGLSKNSELLCYPDGYEFDYKNGNMSGLIKYDQFAIDNYFGGSCFFSELTKLYGDDVIKKIISNARNQTKGKHYFFGEMINPIIKDDYKTKTKFKSMITGDIQVMQLMQFVDY